MEKAKKVYAIEINKTEPEFVLVDTKQNLNRVLNKIRKFKKEAKALINKLTPSSEFGYEVLGNKINEMREDLMKSLKGKIIGTYHSTTYSKGKFYFGYWDYYSDDIKKMDIFNI